MSLIKTIRQQLGLSVTPANNFTLDASADNGTMKLARGNAGATTQDIMTVDAAGKVAFPAGNNEIGVGQTWQDVTASRAAATLYTNSTGKPIMVSVRSAAANGCNMTCTVGGVIVDNLAYNSTNVGIISSQFIVPAGATYRVDFASSSLGNWIELR